MQVAQDKVVSIDYTLTGPQGEVLDSSQDRGPLTYLQGVGNIIPGLEKQLEGKSTGDQVKVTVPAAEAYGERDERLVQPVPRDSFKGVERLEPGMRFQASGPNGAQGVVTIVSVDQNEVTIDANHPLAGVPLTFDVTVVDVRDATEEERAHRHAHGPDGHQPH
jgi:FKBP-type peptidyl-prolyl cis-trans isomerase SlyD